MAALGAPGDDWMLQQYNRGVKRLDLVRGSALCKRGRHVGWSIKMHVHVYIHLGSVSDVQREQLIAAALRVKEGCSCRQRAPLPVREDAMDGGFSEL